MGDTIFLDVSKKMVKFVTVTVFATAFFLLGTLIGFFVGLFAQATWL